MFHHFVDMTGCLIGGFCVTGHLIGLLEALGTLSMTAWELKQLISLFRVDEEGKQVNSMLKPVCDGGGEGHLRSHLVSKSRF